jgi:hypothetical protein
VDLLQEILQQTIINMDENREDEVMVNANTDSNLVIEMQDAIAGVVQPPAVILPPSFIPAPLNFVSTSGTTREYGKMKNQDVFCNVLQRLGIASNAQINKLLRDIRPVSRSAAETVSIVLQQKDWLAPLSTNAQLFHNEMGEMLLVPAPVPGLTQKDMNAMRTTRLAHFAHGMSEYRTILFVQQEGFEMLLKHVSVWPAAPTSAAAGPKAKKQKDKNLFLFREHEKKMLGIINNSMRWHNQNLVLQRTGCRLLERFVMRIMTGDKTEKNTLIVPNAVLKAIVDTILFALKSFPLDEELAQVACCALAASCYSSHFERASSPNIRAYTKHRHLLAKTGVDVVVISKMLELMRTFADNEILVEAACNITQFFWLPANPALNHTQETVFNVMNAHISNDYIQMYGCLTMWSYSRNEGCDDATTEKYIQFFTNTIQMSQNKYLIRAAMLACIITLQNVDKTTFKNHQNMCGESGLLRLIVICLHSLVPQFYSATNGNERARRKLTTLVENNALLCMILLRIISADHALNNYRLIMADAPQTLMYLQTAFSSNMYKGLNVVWQNQESIDYFVWQTFAGFSVQPTSQHQRQALRLFCAPFSCLMHDSHVNVKTPANTFWSMHTPVHLCCETLSKSGNIKALSSTLSFLELCVRIPEVAATIGDELTLAMVIAITRSDACADSKCGHDNYVRKRATKVLEILSRTRMLRTERGLNNTIFKLVDPALATDIRYMKNLTNLQTKLLDMEMHYVCKTVCTVLSFSKLLNIEEKNSVSLLQNKIGTNIGPSTEMVFEYSYV